MSFQLKPPPVTGIARWYSNYLRSIRWIRFRDEIFAIRSRTCEMCGNGDETLHLHHQTYEFVTQEIPSNVLVVCETCHKKCHARRIIPYMWRIYEEGWKSNTRQELEPEVKR